MFIEFPQLSTDGNVTVPLPCPKIAEYDMLILLYLQSPFN